MRRPLRLLAAALLALPAAVLPAAVLPATAQSLSGTSAEQTPAAPPPHNDAPWEAARDTVPDLSGELAALLDVPVSAASRYEQRAREAPASVTVVTADEIARYGYRALHEILATVPGFFVSDDRNYISIGVRGFGTQTGTANNRILVLLDGQPLNESLSGGALAGWGFVLDPARIERVEVVHGPGSVVYGSGALLAVVNVITRPLDAGAGLRLALTGGSEWLREGTLALARPLGRAARLDAAVTWGAVRGADLYFAEFDRPETNRGVAEDLDWMRRASADVRLSTGALDVRAWAKTFGKGIPTGAWNTAFNAPGARTRDDVGLLEARLARTVSPNLSAVARAYAYGARYYGVYPYAEGDAPGATVWPSYEAFDNGRVGADVQARWDPAANHHVVAGVDGRWDALLNYRLWDDDEEYTRFRAPFGVLSVFVQDEFQALPELALALGLRHDRSSATGGATSPRAALVFTPTAATAVKVLYGEAFRAATPYERLYEDPLAGVVANAALRPERVATAEVNVEQSFGRFAAASASAFRYRIRHLVEQDFAPGPDSLLTLANRGQVDATGVSGALLARFGRYGEARASYAWQNARARAAEDMPDDAHGDDAGEQVVNAPRHVLHLRAAAALPRAWSLAVEARRESSRRTFFGTETPAFWLHHATVSGPLGSGLYLTLGLRNALDARYAYPGGLHLVQPAIVQHGRSGFVRLALRL